MRILAIGDAGTPTGFARVIRSVFERLLGEFSVHQLATRYRPGTVEPPWPIYPAAEHGDVYGLNRIPELVAELRPQLVFILYDIPFIPHYLAALRAARSAAKVVAYCPVDAGPLVPELIERLHGLDRCVLFTEYGRREVERALASENFALVAGPDQALVDRHPGSVMGRTIGRNAFAARPNVLRCGDQADPPVALGKQVLDHHHHRSRVLAAGKIF